MEAHSIIITHLLTHTHSYLAHILLGVLPHLRNSAKSFSECLQQPNEHNLQPLPPQNKAPFKNKLK